jgi:hypothetical protein
LSNTLVVQKRQHLPDTVLGTMRRYNVTGEDMIRLPRYTFNADAFFHG